MPSVLLTESIAVELGVSEPWPEDARLFQPLEAEQILLPDRAVCLSVQAFLKMCSLNFKVEMKANAEEMSPSGKVPFIKCGKIVIAEMDPIVGFVNAKGIRLSDHLDLSQRADMRAYMSLINAILHNAELYITWNHKETYNEITKARHGSVYPWPLRQFLCWKKLYTVRSQLACLDWLKKSLDEVYSQVDICCHALSERLGQQNYFFGDKPTELDALVFGHLFTLLQTPLPDNSLSRIVERYQNLVKLCAKVEQTYFQQSIIDLELEEG